MRRCLCVLCVFGCMCVVYSVCVCVLSSLEDSKFKGDSLEVAHFLLTDGALQTQGTLGASDAAP